MRAVILLASEQLITIEQACKRMYALTSALRQRSSTPSEGVVSVVHSNHSVYCEGLIDVGMCPYTLQNLQPGREKLGWLQ